MDAILSDDECIALSDVGNSAIYRENTKFHDRAHHHHSSSSSRRRKHYREYHDRRYSDEERDTVGRTHVKRRGCDIARAKRRRLKPAWSSSDDDCFEVTSREELKVALNINDGLAADSSANRSTLSHKLKAIHNKSGINSDQEDTAKKKPLAKKRRQNKTKSRSEDGQAPISKDIRLFDEHTINDAIMDAIYVDSNHVNHEPTEDDDGVDEAVSLEEQELRLIALKSAVMKKHEARKKRQLVLSIRAYSPTDSLLTPLDDDGVCDGEGDGDGSETANQLDEIDEDNNNMDISPASSSETNSACQLMDMDLVSSNDEDSQGPVVFSSLPKDVFHTQPTNEHCVSWVYGIPLVRNQNFSPFLVTGGEAPYNNESLALTANSVPQTQPIFESDAGEMLGRVVSMTTEEENALRERLIADLHCSENKKKTDDAISPNISRPIADAVRTDVDDVNQDESLEADCLRSLLLSSIKQKKMRSTLMSNTAAEKKSLIGALKQSEGSQSMMDLPNLPKITSNLKEAVKRFQNKSRPKPKAESPALPANVNVSDSELIDLVEIKDAVSAKSAQSAIFNAFDSAEKSSDFGEVSTREIDQNCTKSTAKSITTTQPAARIVSVKLHPATVPPLQTSPKTITSRKIATLPIKPVTPVPKAIKIAMGVVESANLSPATTAISATTATIDT